MPDLDVRLLAQRIDTILDILVAGDYHSAIHNLEILQTELGKCQGSCHPCLI
ncbi:hypothetical protein PT300_10300 [Enterobacteriaceae bacterium ESL0689]|nr:hypothetical protein [Enterobacteriaceae bacterium ESL0689]